MGRPDALQFAGMEGFSDRGKLHGSPSTVSFLRQSLLRSNLPEAAPVGEERRAGWLTSQVIGWSYFRNPDLTAGEIGEKVGLSRGLVVLAIHKFLIDQSDGMPMSVLSAKNWQIRAFDAAGRNGLKKDEWLSGLIEVLHEPLAPEDQQLVINLLPSYSLEQVEDVLAPLREITELAGIKFAGRNCTRIVDQIRGSGLTVLVKQVGMCRGYYAMRENGDSIVACLRPVPQIQIAVGESAEGAQKPNVSMGEVLREFAIAVQTEAPAVWYRVLSRKPHRERLAFLKGLSKCFNRELLDEGAKGFFRTVYEKCPGELQARFPMVATLVITER